MMAACSNEELVPNEVAGGVNNVVKGIVFESAPVSQTRGELNQGEDMGYHLTWFAESDRVNIYATNVKAYKEGEGESAIGNTNNKGVVNNGSFAGTLLPAVYKATNSGSQGVFTAINDENWIQFKNNEAIAVVAGYPQTTVVTGVDAKAVDRKSHLTEKINNITFDATVDAVQEVSFFNEVKAPMVSYQWGHSREKGYESIGEKMPLQLYRPFPVLRFSGAEGNDSFNKDLGKLKSIILETNGYRSSSEEYYLAPTQISGNAYNVKTWKTGEETAAIGGDNKYFTNTQNTAKVVINQTWKHADRLYMAILPISRKAEKWAGQWWDTRDVPENFTVTYTYDNIELVQHYSSAKSWNEPLKVYEIKTLDIEEMYPWIVTKTREDGKRKLIVNKGNFADAFKEKNGELYIKWDGGDQWPDGINCVKFSDISDVEIRSKVAPLSSDDYKKLNRNNTIKTLVVKNNTDKITYNALSNLANLDSLRMDHVTNIEFELNNNGRNHPVNSDALRSVVMPEYDFAVNRTLTQSILNDATLQYLDMSGVTSMKEQYPKDGMSLKGYEKLKWVVVQDDVVLGPESFYGCKELTNVTGFVQLSGYGAFQNCEKLPKVSINGDKIYDYTFDGAKNLKNVYKADGKTAIAPIEIGVNAFKETQTNITLTSTTLIKDGAFQDVKILCGVWDPKKGIYALTVNAATIGKNAFNGCTALQYVHFVNLTKVENGLLENAGTNGLRELKFSKVVTFGSGVANAVNANGDAVFSITTDTKLFINPAQSYVGQKLYLGKTSGNSPVDVYKTFKTIIEE